MAGALLVDMPLPVGDGAVIATISAKRGGKNRATAVVNRRREAAALTNTGSVLVRNLHLVSQSVPPMALRAARRKSLTVW